MAGTGEAFLSHRVSARRPRALILVGLVWLCALLVWLSFGTVWWVPALLVGLTLPALMEAWRNDSSQLTLDSEVLSWRSPRQSGTVAVSDIARVRFDTRMDFAVNARLQLVDKSVLRLPIEVVPPYNLFTDALDRAGIAHERHHFHFF